MLKNLTLIVATCNNNGIGISTTNSMPWHLSTDLKFFAKTTSHKIDNDKPNNVIIMGRKVWDGIPEKFKPLKNRKNVILSKNYKESDDRNVMFKTSIQDVLNDIRDAQSKVFCIGGSQIYNEFLPITNRILLTKIKYPNFDNADIKFPVMSDKDWIRCSHQDLESFVGFPVQNGDIEENGIKFEFQMFVRKAINERH